MKSEIPIPKSEMQSPCLHCSTRNPILTSPFLSIRDDFREETAETFQISFFIPDLAPSQLVAENSQTGSFTTDVVVHRSLNVR